MGTLDEAIMKRKDDLAMLEMKREQIKKREIEQKKEKEALAKEALCMWVRAKYRFDPSEIVWDVHFESNHTPDLYRVSTSINGKKITQRGEFHYVQNVVGPFMSEEEWRVDLGHNNTRAFANLIDAIICAKGG